MKQVRCIETGQIYDSASIAARAAGVTPGMLTHVLKGRQKTAGGFRWEYTGEKVKRPYKPRRRRNGTWYDENGNVYYRLSDLAVAKGLTVPRVNYLMSKYDTRTFRNEWLHEDVTRLVFDWCEPYWCVNDVRFLLRDEAVRYGRKVVRHISQLGMHNALDTARHNGKSVTMYFGPTGWTVDNGAGDLFNGF